MSKLQDLIYGSYGTIDDLFASHPSDRESTRDAIVEAGKENFSYEEYVEMHRKYLTAKGRSSIHIEEQLSKVKNLKSYFE